MTRFATVLLTCAIALASTSARAQDSTAVIPAPPIDGIAAPAVATPLTDGIAAHAADLDADEQSSPRPVAVEYSDAYYTRAKIHKYASFATLPLFATELALGQNIYNDPNANNSAVKGAHIAVGTAITGLFAVNTVTGLWNLRESRHDPHHRTLRLWHGIMMLGADAGFVAAYGTGPGGRNLINFDSEKQTHRAVVFTTMGVATASYLMMLIGNR